MIVVVDYGMSNLGSILNMFRKIGAEAMPSARAADIQRADKLILPGVGAFDYGMQKLKDLDLLPVLNERVLKAKVPILGICLGMQLMTRHSEEGTEPGIGWVDAQTVRFKSPNSGNLKIPHMGWNIAHFRQDNALTKSLPENARFYFVHSFFVECKRPADILGSSFYGCEFVSAFHTANIYGLQFHPEKSHRFGMAILRNFAELSPANDLSPSSTSAEWPSATA